LTTRSNRPSCSFKAVRLMYDARGIGMNGSLEWSRRIGAKR
jgi:hypothetical protein